MSRTISWRTIAGFVSAPLVPGALIVALLLGFEEREEAQAVMLATLYFGYPTAVLLGVPAHVVMAHYHLRTLLAYAGAGALIGALLYVALPTMIEILMQMQGVDSGGHVTFSFSVLPAAMICASVAATSFWLIVRPDRATR